MGELQTAAMPAPPPYRQTLAPHGLGRQRASFSLGADKDKRLALWQLAGAIPHNAAN